MREDFSRKKNYEFIKYASILDETLVLYGLKNDSVQKIIDGVLFIEVTPDFEKVQMVRQDSLRVVGSNIRTF